MSDHNKWSATAAANADPAPNGPPEGMNRDDVNDSMRETMAATRRFRDAADWFDPNIGPDTGSGPYVVSEMSGTTLKIAAVNATAYYPVNRKVRIRSVSTADVYAFVVSAVFSSPDTTVTVEDFDGAVTIVPSDANGLDTYLIGGSAIGGIGRSAYLDSIDPEFILPAAFTAAAINAAISAAAGRIVFLEEGTYNIETPVLMLGDSTLWGRGWSRTILKAAADLDDDMVTIASGLSNIVMKDFLIDGDSGTGQVTAGNGINIVSNNQRVELSNIEIDDVWGEGIVAGSTGAANYRSLVFRNIRIGSPGSHGIRINNSNGGNNRNVLHGINVYDPGETGDIDLTACGLHLDGPMTVSDIEVRMNQTGAHTGAGIRAEQADVSASPSPGFEGELTNFRVTGTATDVVGLYVGGKRGSFSNGYCYMTGATARPLVVDGRGAGSEASVRNMITGCIFEDGLRNEISVDAIDTDITGCRFHAQSAEGMRVDGPDTFISACRIDGSGTIGINLRNGGTDIRLLNNLVMDTTGDGVQVDVGATGAVIDGNAFDNVGGENIDDNETSTTIGRGNTPYEGSTLITLTSEMTNFGTSEVAVTGMDQVVFPYGADGVRQYRVSCVIYVEFIPGDSVVHRMRLGSSGSFPTDGTIVEMTPNASSLLSLTGHYKVLTPAAGEKLSVTVDALLSTLNDVKIHNLKLSEFVISETYLRIELVH